MTKKAIIFDLDNTIYPVSSIGNKLFRDLYELIEQDGRYSGNLETRNPFKKSHFK